MYWHPIAKNFDEVYRLLVRSRAPLAYVFGEEFYDELLKNARVNTRVEATVYMNDAKATLTLLKDKIELLKKPLDFITEANMLNYGLTKPIELYTFESARRQLIENLSAIESKLAYSSPFMLNATKLCNGFQIVRYKLDIEEMNTLRDDYDFHMGEQLTNLKQYYLKLYDKNARSFRDFYENALAFNEIVQCIEDVQEIEKEKVYLVQVIEDLEVDYLLEK